ncbi:TPA: hypothetical protein QCX21_004944, partial [Bacillus toyonensis]|nr:hypothetical protein [Bacillus toyonensis]
GDTLKLESKNNGKSVSTKGNSWSIRVNGKEIFSFFETTKVEQVLQSFNQLPLEKKKGQQFEIVQKSREINRIGTSSGGRLIFSQTGDQLVVYAQNPDQKISNTNISWKISVDGVEKHTFSETATAKDVKASIDRLKLKGQNFEIVHKAGWLEIEGKKYHFNNDGEMQTGWLELDGKTYYINKHRIVKGTWYYFNSSGEMQTGWLELGGVKYYFNNDGAMRTGWLELGGVKYYFNNDGAMRTGWLEFNGKKYHFNDNGAMQTGLKTIGKIAGTWYYFNSSGEMQTEWQTIDGKTYYFDYDGVAKKGWQTIEGKTYYFKYGSGEMATAWENIFGAWYYFNNDGAKQTGWQQIDGKKYYLDIHGIWQEGADWDKQAPLNLTYTSSATANDIQLDENKNAVIDLSFNLAGYIDDYNTYEKPMRYIEIELPEGVTFAGEENTLSADKLKVYVYRKGWHFGSWSNYYNIAVEMKKDSNSGKIWVSKDPLNYYYIHAYANNIKVNVDTSVYKEDTLTFKIGGNTLTTGQKIPRG